MRALVPIATTRRARGVQLACASLAAVVTLLCACRPRTVTKPPLAYPEAVAFDVAPEFSGEWYGEVGGTPGSLLLGELNVGQLYGTFKSDDGAAEYVLLLEQVMLELEEGGQAPGNRMDFTWQDGRGSRGLGWLMINREDTALTGEFGFGEQIAGVGGWSFIRVDDG